MKKSILVVDDDEAIRDSLKASLTRCGYLVYTLKNGQECLDFVKRELPSVIIIDCFMPVLDGLTTVKLLQNYRQKLPIIMMSSDEIKSNCVFLRKPFKFDNLLAVLNNVLCTRIC